MATAFTATCPSCGHRVAASTHVALRAAVRDHETYVKWNAGQPGEEPKPHVYQ